MITGGSDEARAAGVQGAAAGTAEAAAWRQVEAAVEQAAGLSPAPRQLVELPLHCCHAACGRAS